MLTEKCEGPGNAGCHACRSVASQRDPAPAARHPARYAVHGLAGRTIRSPAALAPAAARCSPAGGAQAADAGRGGAAARGCAAGAAPGAGGACAGCAQASGRGGDAFARSLAAAGDAAGGLPAALPAGAAACAGAACGRAPRGAGAGLSSASSKSSTCKQRPRCTPRRGGVLRREAGPPHARKRPASRALCLQIVRGNAGSTRVCAHPGPRSMCSQTPDRVAEPRPPSFRRAHRHAWQLVQMCGRRASHAVVKTCACGPGRQATAGRCEAGCVAAQAWPVPQRARDHGAASFAASPSTLKPFAHLCKVRAHVRQEARARRGLRLRLAARAAPAPLRPAALPVRAICNLTAAAPRHVSAAAPGRVRHATAGTWRCRLRGRRRSGCGRRGRRGGAGGRVCAGAGAVA